MRESSFKKRFDSAVRELSGCWKNGWRPHDFTLSQHDDLEVAGTRWHIAKAVQVCESGFASWVQFWDQGDRPSSAPARKAFRSRLAKALRKLGYAGKPSHGLFRKNLKSLAALRREWRALDAFSPEAE